MLNVAYYSGTMDEFKACPEETLLGHLTAAHNFALEELQRDAWRQQIRVLKHELADLDNGQIYFEFAIPRMGKRADVVLLLKGIVFVIEFKVGSASFDRAAKDQAHDYALDLKNFHAGSHDVPIVPILIATGAEALGLQPVSWALDQVAEPILSSGQGLLHLIEHISEGASTDTIVPGAWESSGYLPTPTIVEAAQALYQNHSVEEIARSDAGAQNLNATAEAIRNVIRQSRENRTKSICFVTGVPGSGKTLAGLNIATETARSDDLERAVFLSGNGPLVTVLREALARDQRDRTGCKKSDAQREVSSFVQNIHHFRDEALRSDQAPPEKIVIFDEAQRAWTKDQASKFMKTKRGQSDFDMSEPEFLISVMDRHEDWCVIVCLVGGGQEINTGEAGLSEWITALQTSFQDWEIYLSNRLADADYRLLGDAAEIKTSSRAHWSEDLHLSVSMRSFRAESLSSFIGHVLDNDAEAARAVFAKLADRYPVVMTRDIDDARDWLRDKARGTERFGIIASSGANRLRPEGLNVRAKIDPANWFLNGPDDVRSAYYLEEAATEFDIQGLEVDWACVCWDADLRREDEVWSSYAFKGTRWQNVNTTDRQLYLKNAYRVILTRARQGMVIFVPTGDEGDPTRPRAFYDGIATFLSECGVAEIETTSVKSAIVSGAESSDYSELVEKLAARIEGDFDLENLELPKEYYYASLPLCVIDSVFSIGVRYEGTANTVRRFCEAAGWPHYRDGAEVEHTVSAFIEHFGGQDPDVLANTVFGNRQRTSSRSGILKADAVMRFAKVLKSHGIQTLADMEDVGRHEAVRRDLMRIPGQGSGLTFDYCLMLAGSDEFVKADRMICRYVGDAIELPGPASVELARSLLLQAVERLRCRYAVIAPRAVDFAIWEYERGSS